MNKYLVYTVSDFRESSINCLHLLYESLLRSNSNFDFYIITNNINYNNNLLPAKYNIILSNLNSNYIGWLKYTNKLPNNYEYYFYFDSDILCYEKLENLISDKKNISIVQEVESSMENEWFNYSLGAPDKKHNFKNFKGVNAGSFAFNSKDFITRIGMCKLGVDINETTVYQQAILEQSCFNYICYDYILNNQYNDITSFVKLRPNDETSYDEKIYHFCGWQGFMDDKYLRMENFHEKYLRAQNINKKYE